MQQLKLLRLVLTFFVIVQVATAKSLIEQVTRRFYFSKFGGRDAHGRPYKLTSGMITLVPDFPTKLPKYPSQLKKSFEQFVTCVAFGIESLEDADGFQMPWYSVKDGGTGDASLKFFVEGNTTSGRPPEDTPLTIELSSGIRRGWSLAILYDIEATLGPEEAKLVTSVRVMNPSSKPLPVHLDSHWTSEMTFNMSTIRSLYSQEIERENSTAFLEKLGEDLKGFLNNSRIVRDIWEKYDAFGKHVAVAFFCSFFTVLVTLAGLLIGGVATGVVDKERAGAMFGAVVVSFVLFFTVIIWM